MKRIQMCRKDNRNKNRSILNHISRKPPRINTVTPEVLAGPVWLQDDRQTSVEIIELNSSDDQETSPRHHLQNRNETTFCDSQDQNLSHAWSYVNDSQLEDSYKINRKARERRRLNTENYNLPTNIDEYVNLSNIYQNMNRLHIDEDVTLNHPMNYFTTLNRDYISSDSSSDNEYGGIEMKALNDVIIKTTDDWDAYNKSYDEEIITCDPNSDKETRTIWIYSFKNKRLLSENDMDMVNSSSEETSSGSTSFSIESNDDKPKDKRTNISRIGSPIPPTCIPRLNLSLDPALSTVTEITESNKQVSSNESKDSANEKFQRLKNSWINENRLRTERSVKTGYGHEKSKNIVNWMALSPRERTRQLFNSDEKWKDTILKIGEFCHSEVKKKCHKLCDNESGLVETIEVQVDIHVSEKSPKNRSVPSSESANILMKPAFNDTSEMNTLNELDYSVQSCMQDHGDHEPSLICNRIINPGKHKDNLDNKNWTFGEEALDKSGNKESEIKVSGHNEHIDRNRIKRTTPQTFHLSIGSITEDKRHSWLINSNMSQNKRRSWLKRLIKCICCK